LVTAILTSAFWIFYFNIGSAPQVTLAGQKEVVDPKAAPPVTVAEGVTIGPAGLAVPVAGIKTADLVDTFTQARAGGARRHDAIDIMAPKGRQVVSAAPGTVEKLFFSDGGGGTTVYVRSDDKRWMYYYAHLSAYAPGLHEGQHLQRGEPVGFVGTSGNADPDGPHLHFAINRMEPGERWWQGTAINPYPLLAAKPASR
jgi:murein DD-endopeptidase MepM/ murein hydrolase activator NlpD